MKIKSLKTIQGPNVFHHRPVLILTLELEEFTEVASTEIPGFTEKLVEWLPGLQSHHCSPGRPGGFIERLRRGVRH
jgi:cyanophycin synthetase